MKRFCTILAIVFILSSNLAPSPALIPGETTVLPPSKTSIKTIRQEEKKFYFSARTKKPVAQIHPQFL